MRIQRTGTLIALLTVLLVILACRYYLAALDRSAALDVLVERLPLQLGEWKGEDTVGLDIRSREILRLDRFVKRRYTNGKGEQVFLYVGYWQKQTGEYQAAKHSPELCLPSNGWHIRREEPRSIAFQDAPAVEAKRLVGDVSNIPFLFYYWFFTGLENYAQEWQALIKISFEKIFSGRSDGGIVEISSPLPTAPAPAEALIQQTAVIEDFVRALYPELRKLTNSAQPAS